MRRGMVAALRRQFEFLRQDHRLVHARRRQRLDGAGSARFVQWNRFIARFEPFVVLFLWTCRSRRILLLAGEHRLGRDGIPADAITVAADGQFIAWRDAAFDDAHAVDANAVGAAEIADNEVIADLGDAAVTARDLARINLDVALGMPANEQDRLIQPDARAFAQG